MGGCKGEGVRGGCDGEGMREKGIRERVCRSGHFYDILLQIKRLFAIFIVKHQTFQLSSLYP